MSHEEMIAQFVARNGVTKCAPTGSHGSNARSLRRLRDERELELSDVGECEEEEDIDHEVRQRETFGRARLNGASVSDALDTMRDV